MLILIGTRGVAQRVATGAFRCPNCEAVRSWTHYRLREWFTFFFIPVVPLPVSGRRDYIECDTCGLTCRGTRPNPRW